MIGKPTVEYITIFKSNMTYTSSIRMFNRKLNSFRN